MSRRLLDLWQESRRAPTLTNITAWQRALLNGGASELISEWERALRDRDDALKMRDAALKIAGEEHEASDARITALEQINAALLQQLEASG